MDNSCHDCGGHLEIKPIDTIANWGEKRVLIRYVPTLVCNHCGQTFFQPEVAKLIQEIAKTERKPDEQVSTIPVREFPPTALCEEAAAAAN